MSHVKAIQTTIKSREVLQIVCVKLDIPVAQYDSVMLGDDEVAGYVVRLEGWTHPVICQLDIGEVLWHNPDGRYGDMKKLSEFRQKYAVENAKAVAHQMGHEIVGETEIENGVIKLDLRIDPPDEPD